MKQEKIYVLQIRFQVLIEEKEQTKKVKVELIQKASDQSYDKSGKLVVPNMEISATTVIRNVRRNPWKMKIEEHKEEKSKPKIYLFKLMRTM